MLGLKYHQVRPCGLLCCTIYSSRGKSLTLTPPLPLRPQVLRMSVFSQNPHSSSSETTSVYHKLSSREYWINFTSQKVCQSKPSLSPSALEMLNEPICPWNSRGVLTRVGGRAEAPSRHARRGPSEACLSEISSGNGSDGEGEDVVCRRRARLLGPPRPRAWTWGSRAHMWRP